MGEHCFKSFQGISRGRQCSTLMIIKVSKKIIFHNYETFWPCFKKNFIFLREVPRPIKRYFPLRSGGNSSSLLSYLLDRSLRCVCVNCLQLHVHGLYFQKLSPVSICKSDIFLNFKGRKLVSIHRDLNCIDSDFVPGGITVLTVNNGQ